MKTYLDKRREKDRMSILKACRVFLEIANDYDSSDVGSDVHFSIVASNLAGDILRSNNSVYVLEARGFQQIIRIGAGDPHVHITVTLKGLKLCYNSQKLY